jgi:hypothetical protein
MKCRVKYMPAIALCLVQLSGSLMFGQSFLFESTFEESVEILQYQINGNPNPNVADIVGSDGNFDWVTDLDERPEVGNFRINYEQGDTAKSRALLVDDPLEPGNTVMLFEIKEPHITYESDGELHQKARVSSSLLNNPNLHTFTNRRRLLIHEDFDFLTTTPLPISWLTLSEYWNNGTSDPNHPFRITLNLQKAPGAGAPLHFGAQAEARFEGGNWQTVWDTVAAGIDLPTGSWVTLEDHFVEGDAFSGLYRVMLTGSDGETITLFDIHNFTHHPDDPAPDGVANFNPMKLYTSGGLVEGMVDHCLCVYWDDFHFDIPSDASTICSADFDQSGVVGVSDVLLLLSEYGCSTTCVTDLDGDGAVAINDILAFLSVFGLLCL